MIPDAADLAAWKADARVAQMVAQKLNCTVAEVPARIAALVLANQLAADRLADARRQLSDISWRDNPPQGSF